VQGEFGMARHVVLGDRWIGDAVVAAMDGDRTRKDAAASNCGMLWNRHIDWSRHVYAPKTGTDEEPAMVRNTCMSMSWAPLPISHLRLGTQQWLGSSLAPPLLRMPVGRRPLSYVPLTLA